MKRAFWRIVWHLLPKTKHEEANLNNFLWGLFLVVCGSIIFGSVIAIISQRTGCIITANGWANAKFCLSLAVTVYILHMYC